MAKKGTQYFAPRKQPYIPPDIRRLGSYAATIIAQQYSEFSKRIRGMNK